MNSYSFCNEHQQYFANRGHCPRCMVGHIYMRAFGRCWQCKLVHEHHCEAVIPSLLLLAGNVIAKREREIERCEATSHFYKKLQLQSLPPKHLRQHLPSLLDGQHVPQVIRDIVHNCGRRL